MRVIEDIELSAIAEMMDFVRGYIDFMDGCPSIDGQETDAERMSALIPILEGVLRREDYQQETVVEQRVVTEVREVIPEGYISEGECMARVRHARESVCPNYRYCVCDDSLSGNTPCYLTDDIGVAMRQAASMGRSRLGTCLVLRIFRSSDGTYRTYIDGYFSGGHYYEDTEHRPYLHFDFITQRVSSVETI